MSKHKPIRSSNLEIHTVADGYIVYDKEADRVHYLNQTASLILELCNGEHEPDEIFQLVQNDFELDQTRENGRLRVEGKGASTEYVGSNGQLITYFLNHRPDDLRP